MVYATCFNYCYFNVEFSKSNEIYWAQKLNVGTNFFGGQFDWNLNWDLLFHNNVDDRTWIFYIIQWRRGRDLNPRWRFKPPYSLSRRAPSTTRPPLRINSKGSKFPFVVRTNKVTNRQGSVNARTVSAEIRRRFTI